MNSELRSLNLSNYCTRKHTEGNGPRVGGGPSYKSIILEFKDIDKFPSTGMWKRAFCTKYRNIARYLSTLSSIVIEDLTKRSRFECPVPPVFGFVRTLSFSHWFLKSERGCKMGSSWDKVFSLY